MAEIVVEDQGCDIQRGRQSTLFEPLRAGAESQGPGLGLALVGQLVAAQSGMIEADSEPGRGSRFTVRLTLASPAPGNAESTELAAAGPADAATATVLVIEDNDDMREYLRQLLAPSYRCIVAPDAGAGLALARKEMPDLVLSDVMLPGRDGFEVCRELQFDGGPSRADAASGRFSGSHPAQQPRGCCTRHPRQAQSWRHAAVVPRRSRFRQPGRPDDGQPRRWIRAQGRTAGIRRPGRTKALPPVPRAGACHGFGTTVPAGCWSARSKPKPGAPWRVTACSCTSRIPGSAACPRRCWRSCMA